MPTVRTTPRVRWAGGALVWSTTPSTRSFPTGRTRCSWSPTTTPRSSGSARCPVPRDADQDHLAWEPLRPEDPSERLERVDAFATHAVLSFRSEVRHRLRVLPIDALDSSGFVIDPLFEAG